MMGKRIYAYAAVRTEEKDKAMRTTPDLQDACVGPDVLKFLKSASHIQGFEQQLATGIISRGGELVRLVPLKLKHPLQRALRPMALFMGTVKHVALVGMPNLLKGRACQRPSRGRARPSLIDDILFQSGDKGQ